MIVMIKGRSTKESPLKVILRKPPKDGVGGLGDFYQNWMKSILQ